jgi:hypothetical protein
VRRGAALALVGLSLVLAACGSGGSGTSTSASSAGGQQQGGPGRGGGLFAAAQTPAVKSCLKKQGVTLPSGRRPGAGGPPPSGQRPSGSNLRNGGGFAKIRAALSKCGVKLPNRPPGGGPPPAQPGTSN